MRPMKQVILTADIHAHRWRQFSRLTSNGMNDRLVDCVSVLDEIDQYARENGIEYAILAGDLFHKRAVLDVETFNAVFDAIKRSAVKWIIEPGNHDQATKDGRVHSLEAFSSLSNVQLMSRRQNVLLDGILYHFFPYQDDENATMDDLKSCVRAQSKVENVAIMHHGFKGARIGGHLETQVKEPLDPNAARAFGYRWIFSGHYHEPQRAADHVYYIGAPLQHSRTDKQSDRGFRVFNTETNKLRLVPIDRPQFVEVEAAALAGRYTGTLPVFKGNFVDLVMEHPDQDVVDQLYKLGARWVEPKYRPQVVLKSQERRLEIDASTDPNDVVDMYVDHVLDEEETKLDADLLKRVGKDLIKEASR